MRGCSSVWSVFGAPCIIPAPMCSLNACVACSRLPAGDGTLPPS